MTSINSESEIDKVTNWTVYNRRTKQVRKADQLPTNTDFSSLSTIKGDPTKGTKGDLHNIISKLESQGESDHQSTNATYKVYKEAANHLNLYDSKSISEKQTFEFDSGKVSKIVFWTESDTKDFSTRSKSDFDSRSADDSSTIYCYGKYTEDDEKICETRLTLSQLNKRARLDKCAEQVLAKVTGFKSRLTGSVDSIDRNKDMITSWRDSPLKDEKTGEPIYVLDTVSKVSGDWSTRSSIIKTELKEMSTHESNGPTWGKVLNDILLKESRLGKSSAQP
ncbi:uncharacterized protein L201_002300 [Kwoniella dendrophila CBS 6074]|uniref:Uncharacterized protein n=1 Tax=Kwoniella dendrophila CBS 6074 TaxID=1295534 RepID=A0AAX4JQR3_9TREE